MPSASIASALSPDFLVRLIKIEFKVVPASLPLIPLLAITPSSVELSSKLVFKFLKVPPTPIYDSIKSVPVVFALLCALEIISI